MQTLLFRDPLRSAGMALGASLALASPLTAQEPPQEVLVDARLLAADGVDGDSFGAALAVDGDILVVAAHGADLDDADDVDSSGVVYVFVRDQTSGGWIQQQQLVPEQGHYEGNFLDMTLAIEGDTIVVGAPYATLDRLQEGAVYVFEPDEAGHWAQTARIVDRNVGSGGHFGASLALAGDLLVVGATQESVDGHGRVGIFERDRGGTTNWGRVTTLYGFNWADPSSSPDDGGNPYAFGSSVAIEGDLLLIGATRTAVGPNLASGAAYFFRRSATDPDRWEYLTRLVAPGADDCVGGLPLFQFYQQATAEEIEAAEACAQASPFRGSSFGERVALQGDTVVVGADSAAGEDGSYSVGAVYVFERDRSGDTWPHVATLRASDPSSSAYFGSDLLLAGETLVVAARGTTVDPRQYQGAVYVFERALASDDWHQTERLIASDGLSFAYFGEALALDGSTRLIGAPGQQARGAVYLHEPALPEEPEDPCAPAFAATAELSGANVATHPSGVMLGAVEGTVSGTLPVWIHEVAPPAEPLFDNAAVLGAYYNVGAECATVAALDAPFVVALPVPDGTDPSNLGVAALVQAEALHDAPLSGSFWQPVSGTYDAANQLYMVTLGALEEAGHTLVLIEHPDLGPTQVTAMGGRSSAFGAPVFLVQCFEFPSGCGVAEEAKVQQKLLDAYVRFSKHGFSALALDHQSPTWSPTQLFSVNTSPFLYKQIYIRQSTDPVCQELGQNIKGHYDHTVGAGMLSFCVDLSTGFPADDSLARTASHELFHAAQYAFDKVREEPREDWVLEATAEVAVNSDDEMHRRDQRDLRSVSVRLTHERGENPPEMLYPYQAQDFWVHLFRSTNSMGMGRNLDLGELASFFEEGASTESVAAYLGDPGSLTFDDLGREYWAWVKNQVAEKTDVTFDGALKNPCSIEAGLVNPTAAFSYPAIEQVFDTLGPLESELIEITFRDTENPDVDFNGLRIVAEGDQLKYKVYLVQDYEADPLALEPDCVQIADGGENGRSFDHLPAGAVVYVLLSRTKHQPEAVEPPLYRVWIDREVLPEQRETRLRAE